MSFSSSPQKWKIRKQRIPLINEVWSLLQDNVGCYKPQLWSWDTHERCLHFPWNGTEKWLWLPLSMTQHFPTLPCYCKIYCKHESSSLSLCLTFTYLLLPFSADTYRFQNVLFSFLFESMTLFLSLLFLLPGPNWKYWVVFELVSLIPKYNQLPEKSDQAVWTRFCWKWQFIKFTEVPLPKLFQIWFTVSLADCVSKHQFSSYYGNNTWHVCPNWKFMMSN